MPKQKNTPANRPNANEEGIVVTAQQSRFHVDANEAPGSKDIDIHDLTISIGGLEILDHAHLKIQDGLHYVFHGRNGTGKSTVLRALAERRIPGVAPNLRLLLLGQTRIEATTDEANPQDRSSLKVLEYVTTSDRKRENALHTWSELSSVVEGESNDASAVTSVVRKLELEKAEAELKDSQLVASRRSGARGALARQDLIEKEASVVEATKRIGETPGTSAEDDLRLGIDMLESVRASLEAMDAGTAETRARMVLLGLGFSEKQLQQRVNELSGGWQSRCELACALTQTADILMLDEPTNFLDLPAIVWLQRHITTKLKGKTIVVVTHDRDFADAIADELLLIRLNPAKTLETFKGDLMEYEAEKHRQIRRMTKMAEASEKKVKHMEDSIQKSAAAAKRTGDDKKLKQAASRRKKIDERSGLEVGLKGGRFKLSRDLAGWHSSNRASIDIPGFDPAVTVALPQPPEPIQGQGSLASFENVSFTYPKSGIWTLKDINLVIHEGARVGVVGMNGTGKTTLLKLLMGSINATEMRASKGTITTNSKARFGYFSQHAVEELERLGKKEPQRTALSHMSEIIGPSYGEQDIRGMLASLGLKGNMVSKIPLASLSGGQRVRLALAEAIFNSPHLLILDEVTTHLDADTISALIDELRTWQGALLVVTHDRYFMRRVVERQPDERADASDDESESDSDDEDRLPGVVYRMFKAGLHKLDGGMSQYEDLVMKTVNRREAS